MIAPPGTRWAYSSPTTQILARIVRDAVGGPEQTLAFAWRELFNPLGMRNVTLEFDGVGTLQGSTWMLASARDWARFGLLYLNDGVVGGKTPAARGLGGFLHRGHARYRTMPPASGPIAANIPTPRAASCSGFPATRSSPPAISGQRIVILPSQKLVIVRLGDSVDPTGDIRGLGRLVKRSDRGRAELKIAISPQHCEVANRQTAYRSYGPPFSSARL